MFKKVVIDAGHGGKDPGAVGSGLQEKNVTLDVAKGIKGFLEQRYSGIKVIMTRDTDQYLTLQQRCDLANKEQADLFISIHVNAANDTATGFESYIDSRLSQASDTAKMRNIIHDSAVSVLPIRDRGKKVASFHVLKFTIMPAVLLEIGFIVADGKHLKSEEYLSSFSLATANGIAAALNVKPAATKQTCECKGACQCC